MAPGLDLADLGQGRFRMDGHGVDDHAALVALYLAHVLGLLVGGEVAVDHTHAPRLGHGNGQPAFRHRIHRRRDQRDIERDRFSQTCCGRNLTRHDDAFAGF